MYRAIDLFAGIGGIRLGFEKGFEGQIETVFASEMDKYAVKTYTSNFKTPDVIHGDITEVDVSDIPSFDICLAGFPCQAFSIAGKQLGFHDDYKGICRGTLYSEVVRICSRAPQPSVIFCENVKGLVNHDKGNTFKVIKGSLEQIGYDVYSKVLNSKYFGVPQNRERIYIVAFRKDLGITSFDFPEGSSDNIKSRYSVVEDNPVSVIYYLSDTYLETLKRHKQRHKESGNGFGFIIKEEKDVASALVCGGMGKERNLIRDDRLTDFNPVTHIKGKVNGEYVRKLTPRECARLQGFPEDYRLDVADCHLYKQLGNSVTVPVIEAIARLIKEKLDDV